MLPTHTGFQDSWSLQQDLTVVSKEHHRGAGNLWARDSESTRRLRFGDCSSRWRRSHIRYFHGDQVAKTRSESLRGRAAGRTETPCSTEGWQDCYVRFAEIDRGRAYPISGWRTDPSSMQEVR